MDAAGRLCSYAEEKGLKIYVIVATYDKDVAKIPAASERIARIAADSKDYETRRRRQYLGSFLNGYYRKSVQRIPGSERFDTDGAGDKQERK